MTTPAEIAAPPPPARQRSSGGAIALGIKALLKGGKLLKLGLIGGSVLAYSALYTWEFAIVLTAAIAIHEFGHVFAMRRLGIPTRGMFLIPFFGGVALGSRGETARQEAIVAGAGPAFGLLSLLPIMIAFAITGESKWVGYGSFIALINLFNLMPIGILDGGRILRAILSSVDQRLAWIGTALGLIFGFALVIVMHAFVLALVIVFSALELVAERRRRMPLVTPMTKGQVAVAFVLYLGLGLVFGAVIEMSSSVPGASLPRLLIQD